MSKALTLDNGKRARNYFQQRGTFRMTPAQRRRLKHKFHKSERVREINRMPERPCGGTKFCVTGSGNRAKTTHKRCEAALAA